MRIAMKTSALLTMAGAAALLAATLASAQPGPRGPGPAASGASAPRMGMGMGGMMGRRFGPENTGGWAMTPAERDAHRERMRSFKNEGDCRAYMDEHHKLMSERARERGRGVPGQPRQNACAGLPK
jgi:hypothetical protein